MKMGSVVGPYRIERELGSGGMGTVYAAVAAGRVAGIETGATVALKVVHPHLVESPGFFKRFLREAELGKAVRHPNVVQTLDCDATGGAHYLVMEYVEGQTLRGLLDETERVPDALCRHIAREIAKGLGAIHAERAVHRDVKPANVLITDEHVVKVMDLGVARSMDEAARLSQTGAFVGSLAYAAPECFQGDGDKVDHRTDLHALGVLVYELASGVNPYAGTDVADTVRRVLEVKPRRLGDVNPQVSPFLEQCVHTLLAKDADLRFTSAAEVAEVLRSAEGGEWWRRRAADVQQETRRPLRRVRIPRETAVYGRDAELARLKELYDGACAGDGAVVLLEGEAGIGKSRLVDEFVGRLHAAGENVNFVFGSYPPGGAATAEGGFSTAYREQFGDAGSADYLTETPLLVPAFDALLRGDARPTDSEPLTKQSLQTCFVHATRALARERATIVLIDDLHFAPDGGRALFTALAMAVPGHRVLLIGTTRRGGTKDWLSSLVRLDHTTHLELNRLGPKDLFALLQDTFESEQLAAKLAGQIGRSSDGNPFFAFEIIRGLREGQFVTQRADGTWTSTSIIEQITIPSSVLDLVDARVADLADEDRELLEVAACCGFEFDGTLVAEALGMARIPAFRRLARLEKKLRLVRSSGRNHVFDHHQIREALYDGMPEVLREEYHAALAEALAARAGEDIEALSRAECHEICRHFLAGNRVGRGLPYLDRSLSHLADGHLVGEAIELSGRALDAKGLVTGEARLELIMKRHYWLVNLGRPQPVLPPLEEARDMADALGITRTRIVVRREIAHHYRHLRDFEKAHAVMAEGVALAREHGLRDLEASLMNATATLMYFEHRFEDALPIFDEQLALSEELGSRRQQAMGNSNKGLVLLAEGRHEEARVCFARALELATEIGDIHGQSVAIGNLGGVAYSRGRWREACEAFERDLALNRQIGDRRGETGVTANLGVAARAEGRYTDARDHHERYVEIAREMGDRSSVAGGLGMLATWYTHMGDPDAARRYLDEGRAIAADADDRRTLGWSLRREGELFAQTDRLEEAARALAESAEIGNELRLRALEAEALCMHAAVLVDLDRIDEAREDLRRIAELIETTGSPGGTVLSACQLARLPGGDAAAARAAMEEHESRLEFVVAMQARYELWRLEGDTADIREARRRLSHLREQAPSMYRESMIQHVRLHREIEQGWRDAERGESATRAG